MSINASDVKRLRDETGAGMMECKRALEDTGGDVEKAKELLRERGLASAKKYAERAADEGLVETYLHSPDPHLPAKVGVLLELNCATDFVAKNEQFRTLARELCMHISFANPLWTSREEVPPEVVEKERELFQRQAVAEGKPEHILEKIVDGKVEGFYAEHCLLDQPYIRDPKKSVGQLIGEASSALKEPVKVRRFARFKVGVE